MEAEIIPLQRPSTRQYRWDNRTAERLDKLADLLPTKNETEILSDALASFLSQLERDEKVSMIVPSEQTPQARKAYKRGPDAS